MPPADLRKAPFVLLDDNRPGFGACRSTLFHSPDTIIEAKTIEDVAEALLKIDRLASEGYYLAGWIAYECAYALEEKLQPCFKTSAAEPLIWMMATKHRKTLSPAEVATLLYKSERGNKREIKVSTPKMQLSKADYFKAIERIQEYIQTGDVYQVNYTMPASFELMGDPLAFYENLREQQPVAFGAYIDTGHHKILSRSPELFIQDVNGTLKAKPMKGTAARGLTPVQDIDNAQNLLTDEKSRAENLMIVDLLRNDLSRISEAGSVSVNSLYDLETYPTLHQMTSTITAKASNDLTISEMIGAIFPCGSVTGAPKIRAMEIISELELEPRGAYCGAIGYIAPPKTALSSKSPKNRDWMFNVPIRTLMLEGVSNSETPTPIYKGRFHIGSGIVADSEVQNEYDECLLKAEFITRSRPEFSLIETFRLQKGELLFKTLHLKRLCESAHYFGFIFDENEILEQLTEHCSTLKCDQNDYRIRLLLDKYGATSITSVAIENQSIKTSLKELQDNTSKPVATAVFAKERVSSKDLFLFHKTTNRSLYNKGYRSALSNGHIDTLYLNEKGNVAEGAIHNVFALVEDDWITPSQEIGLLNGILRKHLLDQHEVIEKTITHADLLRAEMIVLGNSVRGLTPVSIEAYDNI